MSTVVSKNVQIGADGTASNNFTAYQPAAPDGTLRIGNGNSGSVTDAITLTSAGNVGIGTSSPAAKLHVVNTAYIKGSASTDGDKGITIGSGSGAVNTSSHAIRTGGGLGDLLIIETETANSSGQIVFNTNSAERMRIDSAGNVGIGTSAPTNKLHVVGTAKIEGSTLDLNDAGTFTISQNTTASALILRTATSSYLRFDTNGANERVRIDSNGNVGIGTSSPTQKLHISNNGNAYQLIDSSGIANGYNAATLYKNSERQYRVGTLGTVGGFAGGALVVYDETAAAWRMVINSAGNVGIGTSSPTYKVDVSGTGRFTGSLSVLTGATDTAGLIVGADATVANTWTIARDSISTGDLKFIGNTTERMRISAGGSLLVGTTSAPAKLTVSGAGGTNVWVQNNINAGTGAIVSLGFSNDNGLIGYVQTSGSTTSYITSSDYRLKTDIQPMTGASDRVLALNPVNFEWISSGERVDGFLAHEAAEVVPEAVSGEKDAVNEDGSPKYQGIDQSKLVPLLTAALQEALARIETLEADVATLKGAA